MTFNKYQVILSNLGLELNGQSLFSVDFVLKDPRENTDTETEEVLPYKAEYEKILNQSIINTVILIIQKNSDQ